MKGDSNNWFHLGDISFCDISTFKIREKCRGIIKIYYLDEKK